MKPQRLIPSLVGRPWGRGRFGTSGGEPVGEVWVSGDDATLADGRTLASAGIASSVPLVKLLDVGAWLSVQVHPNDRLARELHGRAAVGKHEAWVVLEADADASFAIGLVDPSRLADLFSGDECRVIGSLAVQRVTAGSVIDVAPGTVHAPGPGVLLYEVQQRSDLTYRIWDWGRSRPLHRSQARRAIRADAGVTPQQIPDGQGRISLVGPATPFRLELCRVAQGELCLALERRAILSPIRGQLGVNALRLTAGSHWLLEPGETCLVGPGEALLASWR